LQEDRLKLEQLAGQYNEALSAYYNGLDKFVAKYGEVDFVLLGIRFIT
jgi:hypothetical protein